MEKDFLKLDIKYEELIYKYDINVTIKPWGFEKLIANTELYSLKLLVTKDCIWSSEGTFHYHELKDETFYVLNGALFLQIWEHNIEDKIINKKIFQYETFRVKPFTRHRFKSWSKSTTFLEVATKCFPDDSYRIKCPFEIKEI